MTAAVVFVSVRTCVFCEVMICDAFTREICTAGQPGVSQGAFMACYNRRCISHAIPICGCTCCMSDRYKPTADTVPTILEGTAQVPCSQVC